MASSKGRKYDIILLGATGYTGKLCAEYITGNLPTDIKWAIAGRSQPKLEALVSDLKTQDQDRSPPGSPSSHPSTNLIRLLTLVNSH